MNLKLFFLLVIIFQISPKSTTKFLIFIGMKKNKCRMIVSLDIFPWSIFPLNYNALKKKKIKLSTTE